MATFFEHSVILGHITMKNLSARRFLLGCTALPLAVLFVGMPAIAQNAVSAPTQTDRSGIQEPEDRFQIRFRADTLILTPVLNACLGDGVRAVVRGEVAQFHTFNNYPAFIERGEIRIFIAGQSSDAEPLAKVIVGGDGVAKWQVPDAAPSALYFVYRVTAKDNKFDETIAQELTIVGQTLHQDLDFGVKSGPLADLQIDKTARRTIDLNGLMASVTGKADPNLERVIVSGREITIDPDGRFAWQQIVPRENGDMDVVISRNGETIKRASQNFASPTHDWFIVGQGDLTLGRSSSSGPAREVSGDTLAQGQYAIGRAAFYAKGVIADDVKITASIDTGETSIRDIFSNLDRKDPRQLLRRLNTEQYYPTFGDSSALEEDAPTQGRFFLRAAKGASQLVVGNFVTDIAGSELVQLDRGLFGGLVDLRSNGVTTFGERRAQLTAFASSASTVPAREEFRGTGGSLYFLRHQDISIGSERVRIEVRDRETGLVLESRPLFAQQDYDFDPFQGRLTLLSPLASTVATESVVRDRSSSGNVPVLVVRYEYSPPVSSLEGGVVGGRGSFWVSDKFRFGATAQRDTAQEADQTLMGADTLFRLAAGTYARAEIAQSQGLGFDQSNSLDGGLSFSDIANPGSNATARAWRTEVSVNVAELRQKTGDLGNASAFFEHFDQGFSSAGHLSPTQVRRWGLAGELPFAQTARVSAKYDELSTGILRQTRAGTLTISNRFGVGQGAITAKAGLRFDDLQSGLSAFDQQAGSRTDSALELEFAPRAANWTLHAFGQATLQQSGSRSRNNRIGVGGKSQITQRLSLESEISGGDGGFGADVQLNHRRGEGSESFVGYALSPDRSETGFGPQNIFTRSNRGTLTLGARQRFSDSFSITAENRLGMGGTAPSLSRSFGARFDPTQKLSIAGSFENGKIRDETTGLFRRTAASLSFGYTFEDVRLGAAIELRDERGAARNQRVWLLRNNLSYGLDQDWRFVGQVNIARAVNNSLSIRESEFTDATAGFAYRPVDHERVNALFRVQYVEDIGPVGQITGSGQTQSPKQVSTILSADINYDMNSHLTFGAKYGFRQGKVALARNSDAYVSADAHLGVVRLDYNVIQNWDVLAEGRALWVNQTNDVRLGALAAVYRHLGNHVKVGIGYSWSDFSDDLADQSYSSHGPFLNLVSKF